MLRTLARATGSAESLGSRLLASPTMVRSSMTSSAAVTPLSLGLRSFTTQQNSCVQHSENATGKIVKIVIGDGCQRFRFPPNTSQDAIDKTVRLTMHYIGEGKDPCISFMMAAFQNRVPEIDALGCACRGCFPDDET